LAVGKRRREEVMEITNYKIQITNKLQFQNYKLQKKGALRAVRNN
jgi:hypothetical protein